MLTESYGEIASLPCSIDRNRLTASAMEQLTATVTQDAENVQQAAAARSLQEQAANLQQVVSVFKLDEASR